MLIPSAADSHFLALFFCAAGVLTGGFFGGPIPPVRTPAALKDL